MTITCFINLKLSIMETKFLIFCETKTDSGSSVRYLNGIIEDQNSLQDRLVHLNSIGVKAFKVLPLFVDKEQGLVNLKF